MLLKGNVDIVSDGTRVKLNRTGNPAMTVGGTGDVLSGVVAGLMAMGTPGFEASVAGAYLHGLAGELVRADLGSMGMVASDLLLSLPRAIQQVQKGA